MCFLVEPQNQGRGFSNLGLKTGNSDLVIWGLKIIATLSWFVSQNQAGFDLSVAP
jgi:hypothetical protein